MQVAGTPSVGRLWTFSLAIILSCSKLASAQEQPRIMQIAKLVIDTTQLEKYKAMLKEGVETAIRVEPGVLTIYAVYEKDRPAHVTVFEVYANDSSYRAHLKTPHFLKYKTGTKDMVRSLELIRVDPIALGGGWH